MEKGYANNTFAMDTSTIEMCKKRHVGTHGWETRIQNRRSSIAQTREHALHTNFLVPYAPERDLYIRNKGKKLCIFNIKTGQTHIQSANTKVLLKLLISYS